MPFATLHESPINRALLVTPVNSASPSLAPSAPALRLMTDFAAEAPHVVAPDRPIEHALRDMIGFGVRLLLVVRDGNVLGIVTSYDLMGERPIQFMQPSSRDGAHPRHVDVQVGDVMTTVTDTRPLRYRWVANATVGEIATLFRSRADSHLLVVEDGPSSGEVYLRGIFSRTRLARQLDPLAH